jgi:ribosomal protein S18 acetylase RimI-like enzyme
MPGFTLRAATSADTEFLWSVQREALAEYITAQFGTDETEQRAFFENRFDLPSHQIVRVEGVDAGFLSVEARPDHICLRNIALSAPFRSAGVGTALVRYVIDRAGGLPVRLQVLKSNPPAQSLYQRLGFRRYGETSSHVLMERLPNPVPGT